MDYDVLNLIRINKGLHSFKQLEFLVNCSQWTLECCTLIGMFIFSVQDVCRIT